MFRCTGQESSCYCLDVLGKRVLATVLRKRVLKHTILYNDKEFDLTKELFSDRSKFCTAAGVTILLSLTVFLLLVAEAMPPTSDALPLIGQCVCVCVGVCVGVCV